MDSEDFVTRPVSHHQAASVLPTVVRRERTVLSPWVTLVARWMEGEGFGSPEPFHSLEQADYVTVLARTVDGQVAFVEQYRPALERVTMELPGGLVESGDPAAAAIAELLEETGLQSTAAPELLAVLDPDSGRLENRLWCFAIDGCEPASGWLPERQVHPFLLPASEVGAAIADGRMTHALHIAVIAMALLCGKFDVAPPAPAAGRSPDA